MADGTPCAWPDCDYRPWFIKRQEVQGKIDAERLYNKPWSAEKIRAYEAMLAEGFNAPVKTTP